MVTEECNLAELEFRPWSVPRISSPVEHSANLACRRLSEARMHSVLRSCMSLYVLGRDSGFLAVMSTIAGGADAVMVPEFETESEELLKLINESYDKGKPRFTVVAAEGASPSASEFRDFVNDAGGSYQADLTVLGHSNRAEAQHLSTACSPPDSGPRRSRRSPTKMPGIWLACAGTRSAGFRWTR